ncbi:unnamed protein product [Parascedosporium putredinis]|uniref:Uncharacterized protein n=1 Tax=Parascedosporium putredinis TaxID=1442378 RepID=A0A9P1H3T0_9PEZI|nr:unnamed protein product [Parascedosporium putredinis]CAI7995019.1 unnamed protein product [Parascedosporium putredinis]
MVTSASSSSRGHCAGAKSAAALLPLACEMAKERRNYVHYAILSRNEQPIKAMMRLNGVDDSCGIIFHDARPDRAAESADMRAETSAERAFCKQDPSVYSACPRQAHSHYMTLDYLESYLHPQAVIIDTADDEEPTFTEALRHYRKGNLKYALLEYRYSAAAIRQHWGQRLVAPKPLTESELSSSDGTPFLWQAPSSGAMLILGDKWRELHNFVSLGHETRDAAQNPPLLLTEKSVSKAFPAWLEALLQLSRLRGYFTLYPSAETASTLAVVHEDLFHLPEEYSADKDSEALRARLKNGSSRRKEDPLISHSSLNAMHTLPQGSLLLPFRSLPFLDWEGNARPLAELDEDASEYAYEFKRTAGKCSGTDLANGKPDSSTKDLFCWTK